MLRLRLILFARQFRNDWEIYSLKVFTLSVAFACALLAIAFGSVQLTVNHYHHDPANSGRILLRNEAKDYYKNRTSDRIPSSAIASISESCAGNLMLSRVKPMQQVSVIAAGKLFNDESLHAAEPGLVDILSLKPTGESATDDSTGVLLSATAALRFYGTASAVGRPILFFTLGDTLRSRITGVFHDPENVHEAFHILLPLTKRNLSALEFDQASFTCYFRSNGARPIALIEQEINDRINASDTLYRLQTLDEIYFGPRVAGEQSRHGDSYSVMILLCISALIFFLALTNYTNLTTLTLPGRSTEFAVKKVAGAKAASLIVHLLHESLIICSLSLILGAGILLVSQPLLKEQFGVDVYQWMANADQKSILAAIALFSLTTLSPLYPAVRFAGATPVRLLSTVVITFPLFKKVITITQLGISISLIVAGLVVHRQISRSLVKEPGRNQDQVVYLPFPPELTKLEELKLGWKRHNPNIVEVTATSQLPNNIQSKDPAGRYYRMSADHDFLTFFGIEKISGRWFGPNDTTSLIVNQLAHLKGMHAVGVIENFGSRFNQAERPVVISREQEYTFLYIRILEVNIRETRAYLHRFFREFTGHDVRLSFMDKKFEAALEYEDTLNRLSALFSTIAGIMACCSIYALSLNRVNDTLKQIAIRTTFGASRFSIVMMLSQDFLQLLLASMFFFGPITFLLLREWLRNFAYAAHMQWSDPVVALVVCLVIVAITNGTLINRISRQALQSALRG